MKRPHPMANELYWLKEPGPIARRLRKVPAFAWVVIAFLTIPVLLTWLEGRLPL